MNPERGNSEERLGWPVIVALGSNQGNSERVILEAIGRLEALAAGPIARSSLWQTMPIDCPPGSPPFINAVVSFNPRVGATPESLLASLQEMEGEFGRRPKRVMNEPRPLDLDLIAFGEEKRASGFLTLPHPRAHLRRFVIEPLCEIARDRILPGQSETVAELLNSLPRAALQRVESRR